MGEGKRYRLTETMYQPVFGAVGALLESAALRDGDPRASRRRAERYAKLCDTAPPLMQGMAIRSCPSR